MDIRFGVVVVLPVTFAIACGATFAAPTQRLADAESAQRSAQELGAAAQPAAKLHLKLADEQMTRAKKAMADGDNRAADSLLIRAKADSELALALAREQSASTEVQKAVETSTTTATINASQGAVK
jgi:hypothetical protein